MSKRYFSVLLALALIAGVFGALPAHAQAVAVPDTVQIDDPKGDANFLNDQDNAYGTPVAGQGDHVLPADIGTATDIMKVWFSNTASEISLNIQLEGNPANLAYDTYFRFSSNAGQGPVANDTTRGCLEWIASVNGVVGAYTGATEGRLTDKCNVGTPVTGPLAIAEAAGGGFVLTITFPRDASPLFADGQKVTAPFGVSRIVYVGPLPAPAPPFATGATVDNTKRGTDYTIAGGGPVVQPEPAPTEPPGKSDPPGKGKKKGCEKGKGKKKGACPGTPMPPAAAACAPYVPGEEGAEAETSVVTDAATEEKPVVVELTASAGGPGAVGPIDERSHVYQNVQVDSAAAEAGLWVRIEFTNGHDYDLALKHANGSTAASSGESQPVAGLGSGSEGGHEGGSNYEMITGMRTADCAGFTTDIVGFATTGGPVTVSYWLGETKFDGEAPGEEAALATFFGFLGVPR